MKKNTFCCFVLLVLETVLYAKNLDPNSLVDSLGKTVSIKNRFMERQLEFINFFTESKEDVFMNFFITGNYERTNYENLNFSLDSENPAATRTGKLYYDYGELFTGFWYRDFFLLFGMAGNAYGSIFYNNSVVLNLPAGDILSEPSLSLRDFSSDQYSNDVFSLYVTKEHIFTITGYVFEFRRNNTLNGTELKKTVCTNGGFIAEAIDSFHMELFFNQNAKIRDFYFAISPMHLIDFCMKEENDKNDLSKTISFLAKIDWLALRPLETQKIDWKTFYLPFCFDYSFFETDSTSFPLYLNFRLKGNVYLGFGEYKEKAGSYFSSTELELQLLFEYRKDKIDYTKTVFSLNFYVAPCLSRDEFAMKFADNVYSPYFFGVRTGFDLKLYFLQFSFQYRKNNASELRDFSEIVNSNVFYFKVGAYISLF